jgi:hypothetical protein
MNNYSPSQAMVVNPASARNACNLANVEQMNIRSQRAGAVLRPVNSLTGKVPRRHPWLATIDNTEISSPFFATKAEAIAYGQYIVDTIGWPLRELPKSKVRRRRKG